MMKKTTLIVSGMDCPSEERLIRMKLEGFTDIYNLSFDIPQRKLYVYHQTKEDKILAELSTLNLGAVMESTELVDSFADGSSHFDEKKLLYQVLFINFFFFLLEVITGFIAGSMGLVADSLDMLADSIVYGLALYAVGGAITKKKKVAKISGFFQLFLALLGITEVLKRFLSNEDIPDFKMMIIISFLALAGNALSLIILQKSKNKEAHIQASIIFTSNDVIINIGVILAGILVFIFDSKIPDLTVGSIIFFIVARGAFKILELAK